MDLSVVVPVRNEAENIEFLIAEIRDALADNVEFEIIYVNDGSTDNSNEILQRLQHTYNRLRVIQHRNSYGQSTAIRTGVKAAYGSWVVTLDGDGQNDPADIPKLLNVRNTTQDENLQMICGYRVKRQDNWLRRLSSQVANAVRAGLLNDQAHDTGCGLKLFRRDLFLDLPYFDHMHRFLPALVLRQGSEIAWVKVNHRPRLRGQSKYGLFDRLWVGIIDMLGVMWLQRRAKRPEIIEEK